MRSERCGHTGQVKAETGTLTVLWACSAHPSLSENNESNALAPVDLRAPSAQA